MDIYQVTELTKLLSKDPTTQVGASLVKHGQIVSIGYNGMPRGFDDDQAFFRDEEALLDQKARFGHLSFKHYKYNIFEHAERNLMYNFLKTKLNTKEIFCLLSYFPSCEEARALISCGVKNVIVSEVKRKSFDDYSVVDMFEQAGVTLHQINTYHPNAKTRKFYENYLPLGNFCFLLKEDFSILGLSDNVLSVIYELLSEYLNSDYTLYVTMQPCLNCLKAIAHAGIKNIIVTGKANNQTSNIWKQQEQSAEYQEIVQEFGLNISCIQSF